MIYYDKLMKEKREELIQPFSDENVTAISYDLSTEAFALEPGKESRRFVLDPGDSVFVKSKETIELPANVIGKVILRNSRIRQGLDLTAPIYYTGHHTKVLFRVTNISKKRIELDTENGIASLMFEDIGGEVEKVYSGAFQKEFDFNGMGSYSSEYQDEIFDIEKKVDDIRHIEKNIYGNVLAIMAVFVGVFSLVNINLQNVSMGMLDLISLDLTMVGAVGFFIAIINTVLPGGRYILQVWGACIAAFATAILLQLL